MATLPVWVMILNLTVPAGFDFSQKFMATSGDAVSRITWLYLLGAGVYVLWRNLARTKVMLRWLNPFLLAFIVLAGCSILWSIDPAVSNRRFLRAATMLITAIGFTLVGWRPRRFQSLLRAITMAILVSSIIFIIVDPVDGIHHADQAELKDAWHGITFGKNILGSFASVGVVLWLHAWLAKEATPLAAVCGMALSAGMLVMTRSAGSLMATAFAVVFLLLLLRSPASMKRYMPYFVSAFATLILIYALAVLRIVPGMEFLLQPITALTGKDLTFTGRTAIWAILNENIVYHPWFGGGYGAYWVGPLPQSPSFEMLTRLYFYPSEGHNGYIDVVNDLGFVGGGVLLGFFASYIRQAIKMMRFDRDQSALYLTLLFRGFLADMSESHWFFALSADWLIMVLAAACLGRELLQQRLDQQTAPVDANSGQPLEKVRRMMSTVGRR